MGISMPWSKYSRFHVWYRGRKDGKRGIPPIDQVEHTPYENAIQKWAEENIHRVAQEWEKMDQKLKGEYCRIKVALEAANRAKKAALDEHAESSEDVETAQNEINKLLIRKHMSPWGYFTLMIFLGFSEFPLNSIVFDLFGEKRWLTYLMSAGLAVVLPVFAHFVGVILKREPFKKRIINTETVLLFFTIIIPIFTISGIAYFREKFFEATGVNSYLHVQIDPTMITLIFLIINLLIFTGAIIASYFYHDPELRQWEKTYKFHLKEMREDQKEIAHHKAIEDTLRERLQIKREYRQNEWDEKVAEAYEIKKICLGVIDNYRTHNLSRRADPTLPASFKTYPEIAIPKSLLEISWLCTSDKDEKQNVKIS